MNQCSFNLDRSLSDYVASVANYYTALTHKQKWQVLQKWRETYCATLKMRTGKWVHKGIDWHVFSYGYANHVKGERAKQEYFSMSDQSYYVVPGNDSLSAYLCSSDLMSDFAILPTIDIYIFHVDLDWTMVFTHEQDMGLGPYFSRRCWQEGDLELSTDALGRRP
jgi:hypothetical protein